jgi:LppX_LprAFG lipoprotein
MRIAIASLALTVALVGCGSSSDDTEREAVNPLAKAVSATQAESTARMTFTTQGDVSGQSIKGNGSGIVQFKPPKAQLNLKMSAAGQQIAIDEVMDGTTMYMKLPKEAMAGVPGGKSWIKLDLDKASGGALSGAMNASQDPASQLKLLTALAGAKEVGKEKIGGDQTTHYHGELDYKQVAKSGPQDLRKAADLALKVMANTTIPVDVWIDDKGRVRQQRLELNTKAVAGSPAQKQTMTIGYSDFGVDASSIKAPSDSDAYDATAETAQAMEDIK